MQNLDGSPPRAWGQRLVMNGINRRHRFTPTRVGTTIPSSTGHQDFAVHPHARGDNMVIRLQAIAEIGSPPRAWGQLHQIVNELGISRFTPTRVGTTAARIALPAAAAVHPHARGDNGVFICSFKSEIGSPPRAWGQLGNNGTMQRCIRFTPTRVGTTTLDTNTSKPLAVHPHARGDNNILRGLTFFEFGSPPRAWGQRIWTYALSSTTRFTPTRVGTTAME